MQLQPEHNAMRRLPDRQRLSVAGEMIHSFRSGLTSHVIPAIRLTDVSKWQAGPIDYAAMFDPADPNVIDGIVVKATEGTGIIDNLFTQHWQGAVSHAPVMVYHFFRGNLSGSAQATHLLNTIQPLLDVQEKTIVWCDIETSDGVSNTTRINRVRAFLQTVEAALGPDTAGMYSSPSLWSALMTISGQPPVWTSDYWGWVAHWTSAPAPSLPVGWTDTMTALWQIGVWDDHSWIAPVPGISPRVDVNRGYFADRAELAEWIGLAPAPPPPPPPPPGCGCEEELAALEKRIKALEDERIPLGVRMTKAEQKLEDHERRITALEVDPPTQPPPPSNEQGFKVVDTKTLANWAKSENQAGYPVMAIWSADGTVLGRIKWLAGDIVVCDPKPVRADGGTYWLKLKPGPNGGQAVPNTPDLYVYANDVTPL